MFSYTFSRPVEKSPAFKIGQASFCVCISNGHFLIEYHGNPYEHRIYEIEVVLYTLPEKYHSKSTEQEISKDVCETTEVSFRYEFSRATSWYSIPVLYLHSVDISINESNMPCPFSGLYNYGATCYLNSFIQSLYYLNSFKQLIYQTDEYHSILLQRLFYGLDSTNLALRGDESGIENNSIPGSFGSNLAQDECKGEEAKNTGIGENNSLFRDYLPGFIRNLSFVHSVRAHQDVHEFSKYLLDRLENENKNYTKSMEGILETLLKYDCGCRETAIEKFQDLQLSISVCMNKLNNVYESVEAMCQEEIIEDQTCKEHGKTQLSKSQHFKELPEVLFLLINRYVMDFETGTFRKSNEEYEFPEILDLGPFVDSESKDANLNPQYNLYSVIVHSGEADEGHYYVYIKINGNYYKFNDTSVYQASKEETTRWNYGGRNPFTGQEKEFSAYYLIYTRTDVCLIPKFDLWRDRSIRDKSWISKISKKREPILIKYLNNRHLIDYKGPGRVNTCSYAYPIITPEIEQCYEYDNISKQFVGSQVYGLSNGFKEVTDKATDPNEIYLVVPKKKRGGKLVFIKWFDESLWCTYPDNLVLLGTFVVKNLEEIAECATAAENYSILREVIKEQDGSQFGEESEMGWTELIGDFGQVRDGDVLIVTRKEKEDVDRFLSSLHGHRIINVLVKGMSYPIFLKRGLTVKEAEEEIQKYFCSTDIVIYQNVDEDTKIEDLIDEKGTVECNIGDTFVVYTGIENGCIDINHIKHVHLFLINQGSTVNDLLAKFRLSKAVCMSRLQSINDLQVIESCRGSLNVRILSHGEVLRPRNSYIVIQAAMKNPIKVSFFTGAYQPVDYPFFIENPGSVTALCNAYFFSGRVGRFDGGKYRECASDEVLDLKTHEVLLIEKK